LHPPHISIWRVGQVSLALVTEFTSYTRTIGVIIFNFVVHKFLVSK
jgi:hypothetical protein